jgi:hypothetical protein
MEVWVAADQVLFVDGLLRDWFVRVLKEVMDGWQGLLYSLVNPRQACCVAFVEK